MMYLLPHREEWRPWLRLDPFYVGGIRSQARRQGELVLFGGAHSAVEVRDEFRRAFVVAGLGDMTIDGEKREYQRTFVTFDNIQSTGGAWIEVMSQQDKNSE